MPKGQLFIVSAPSGCGKDTIINRVLAKNPNIRLSISSITRDKREGEVEGEKYNFISIEKFKNMIANNELLEHNEYCGNFYGTPRRKVENWLEDGLDVILEIDVNGAEKVMNVMNRTVSIFILPPSMIALSDRLLSRNTEDIDTVKKRLKEAVSEISKAGNYDYIVVNDDIDKAVFDFEVIIKACNLTVDKQKNILNEVQNDAQSFNW